MLKKKNNEYVIDRELTWQLAIENNVELQKRVFELEKENRRLSKLVDKLHVDCVYYENHREPKDWEYYSDDAEKPF